MNEITYQGWLDNAYKLLIEQEIIATDIVAQVILVKVTGATRAQLYAFPATVIPAVQASQADELLQKRLTGLPLSYVVEETEFFSLKITLDENVLVPESETEHLVEAVLNLAKTPQFKDSAKIKIADIGTGSGCILAAIAVNDSRFWGIGTDICEKALKIARANLTNHNVAQKFELIQADILKNITTEDFNNFDFIVSNPPYIGLNERADLSKEVLYQPEVALFGGKQGYEFTIILMQQSYKHLKNQGFLIFEIGQGQEDIFIKFGNQLGFSHFSTIKDYTNINRILIFRK